LGQDVSTFYVDADPAQTPPYIVYVYSPKEEFAVRRNLADLKSWLAAQGIQCVAISLADLFWQAISESGYEEQILTEEDRSSEDQAALDLVRVSLGQILTGPPSLADRVLAALQGAPERSAAFLYRAGALYPTYRTSTILDDLRERVSIPVVLLYPGKLVGAYGLSFMGRCEPAHGYRAKIIVREEP
jgi:hypothetical protein